MEQSSRKVFAQRLRSARDLRGLTQSKLGEIAGLPGTSISHFENEEGTRKPSFDNLRSLAKALNVTTDYLLGRADQPDGFAVDEQLYRDVKSLTDADMQIAKDLIQRLAERNKPKD